MLSTDDPPMICLNVGCGPHRAPEPWINLDCVFTDMIQPDAVVDSLQPLLLFDDNSVGRVYLGHVLEHIPWDDVPTFLADVHRALVPGGMVTAVGPDVYAAIRLYHTGALDQETVIATLEGSHSALVEGTPSWPNARHHWNCSEGRLEYALMQVFPTVTPVPLTSAGLANWPVVSFAPWQCAVQAVK